MMTYSVFSGMTTTGFDALSGDALELLSGGSADGTIVENGGTPQVDSAGFNNVSALEISATVEPARWSCRLAGLLLAVPAASTALQAVSSSEGTVVPRRSSLLKSVQITFGLKAHAASSTTRGALVANRSVLSVSNRVRDAADEPTQANAFNGSFDE
jgi:autotransporter passenger strand-loop-strand repeat protein